MGECKIYLNSLQYEETIWTQCLRLVGAMRFQIVVVLAVFVDALVLSANAWGIDPASVLAKPISPNPYYWAGHKTKLEGDNRFTIEIQYSNDGKSYNALVDFDWRFQCKVQGAVSANGILESKVCDWDEPRFVEREVKGTVFHIIIDASRGGNSGGDEMKDKEISDLRVRYLEEKESYKIAIMAYQHSVKADIAAPALRELELNLESSAPKTKANKVEKRPRPPNPLYWAGHKAEIEGDNLFSGKFSYSPDGHSYKAELSWRFSYSEAQCTGRIQQDGSFLTKICLFSEPTHRHAPTDIIIKGDVTKIILEPSSAADESGGDKLFDKFMLERRARYTAAKTRYTRELKLYEHYKIALDNEVAKQQAKAEAKHKAELLKKREAVLARKKAEAKRKAELLKKREAVLARKKAEAKRKAELLKKREAVLARKKAEAKRKADLLKKREAVLARKKAEAKRKADLLKKREAVLARKKAEAKRKADLLKKREAVLARKKAEAKRKADLLKKREAVLARKKAEAKRKAEKKRESIALFKLHSSKAEILLEDVQAFLFKNPDSSAVIEIAADIIRVKTSLKNRQGTTLGKGLISLKNTLDKTAGFRVFSLEQKRKRVVYKEKVLKNKIREVKLYGRILKEFISKNVMKDWATVQTLILKVKQLDAALTSPKLKELKNLTDGIDKLLARHTPLKAIIIKVKTATNKFKKCSEKTHYHLAVFGQCSKAYQSKDYPKALKEWRPLAIGGNSSAQFNLGQMYRRGQGVPKDHKMAVKWYRLAAKQGDAFGQNLLGWMFETGRGVPKDYKAAVKWYRLAAKQGDASAQIDLGNMYDAGRGVPKDFKAAVKWYQLAAKQGDAFGQANLGWMYENGRGVLKDSKAAVKWYQLAAKQGHARARNNLGQMYANGRGVLKDSKTAVKWYQLAAKQGDAFGQTNLGWMYENGRGILKDYKAAVKWYQLAAKQGDAFGQANLGWMYANGRGVLKDSKAAVKWYQLAAKQGHARAQNNLGQMYANGRGVLKDSKTAVKWYQLAAKQGDAFGQANLGWMYANGRGVLKDSKAAVKWYQLAAKQGHARAQNNLGWMYANGRGVLKDSKAAVKWYRLAAKQGDASAQNNLGWMYANGRGVLKDYKAAVKWYRLAAKQGDAFGQNNLGWMYANGRGVLKDYKAAVKWYRLAAEQGDARAQNNLKSINETIEKAEKLKVLEKQKARAARALALRHAKAKRQAKALAKEQELYNGKVVFSITQSRDYLKFSEEQNKLGETKNLSALTGCQYKISITNYTKFKVRVGQFFLKSNREDLFNAKNGKPAVYFMKDLKPGAFSVGKGKYQEPKIIRWVDFPGKPSLSESEKSGLISMFGCKAQARSLSILYTSQNEFIGFPRSARISKENFKTKYVGKPYRETPLLISTK